MSCSRRGPASRSPGHLARLQVLSVSGNTMVGNAPKRRTVLDLRRLARLRRDTYRLLAVVFRYPQRSLLTAAIQAAGRLEKQDPWAGQLAFYGPWSGFLDSVRSLTVKRLSVLQNGYVALFGDTVGGQPVPLHESAYLDRSSMMAGHVIADVERGYRAAGLSVTAEKEPADHIAVEMDFVSFLCALETHCWESEDRVGALEYVERERAFLKAHPCRWLAFLDHGVAAREGPGLYTDAARAARALTAHDVDFLATLRSSLEMQATAGQGGAS